MGGTRYTYICTPHRFYLFKCKPLCSVCLGTLLITIKHGLSDSYTGEIIFLIESVMLPLVCANVNHLHNDSCLTYLNQNADLG